jgi:hypothetical protein
MRRLFLLMSWVPDWIMAQACRSVTR